MIFHCPLIVLVPAVRQLLWTIMTLTILIPQKVNIHYNEFKFFKLIFILEKYLHNKCLHVGKEVMTSNIDRDIIGRPSSTMSTCSSSNTQQFFAPSMSSSSTHIHSPVIFQPIEKITPELDRFAKRRKYKDEKIEEDIQKSTSSISTALKSIENLVCNKTNSSTDGYMLALHEGLKHVPGKNKTQCFIEMLQIIKKYEEWQ